MNIIDINFIESFLAEKIQTHALKFLAVLALLLILKWLLKAVVKRIVDEGIEKRRAATLAGVLTAIGDTVLYFIIILVVLRFVGIDITPILAGAGIVGLAVGFGGQSLVKDFIAGLLILFENQYNIGDRVQIGGADGIVTRMTVRSTVLRDEDGKIYYIPNGLITTVVNLSRVKLQDIPKKSS